MVSRKFEGNGVLMKQYIHNIAYKCALILSTLSLLGCVRDIDIAYKDLTVIPVQLYDSYGQALGDIGKYLVLDLESQRDLAALDEAILQFRGTVVLPNGERLMEVGMGAIEEKPHEFLLLERVDKQAKSQGMYSYSAFFFRDLKLDYQGRRIVDLLKDEYKTIEFYVSYKLFVGPEIGRSKLLVLTKDDIINAYQSQSDSKPPISLEVY